MSGPEPQSVVATTSSLKRKQFSKDDQHDFDELDRAFKRIKTVVPRVPYVLSAPSLNPYHYHSQQEANAWMMGHLWRHDEEHLQYRTYMYREPCQDCLELQAGEEEHPEPERPDPRTSNTASLPTKKKLNLAGFKVKQVNGTTTPASKKASTETSPTKPAQNQVNGVKKSDSQPATATKTQPKSPKPYVGIFAVSASLTCDRPPTESRDERKATKASRDNPRPDAKPRPPSPVHKPSVESKSIVDKSSQSNTTPHGLPPLLSPVHEPPTNPYGLPDILSPTLPSTIQAELDRLETQRKRAESNASTSSSDRKSTLAVSEAKPKEVAKSEPRIRTVSVNGKPRSPNAEPVKQTEPSALSLIVKLKFSKAKMPTVRQILKLPPKRSHIEKKERAEPSKEVALSSQTKEEDLKKKKAVPKIAARRPDNATPASSLPAKPTGTATAKVPEKRPRADDDVASAVPSKRPRAASSQDRPITPLQHGTSSPSLSTKSSAQKSQSQLLTPKNSQKAASMLRTQSADSNDSTSGKSAATPAGIKSEGRPGPTSAPLNSKKQADIALLAQTSMKLNQMGRALKHEATKILTAAGKQITKQDEKRAAVTNMECIL